MVGLAILTMLAATALFAAAALRLGGLAVTLLAAYVVLVAETTAVTLVLSPSQAVEQEPLVGAGALGLAIAIAVWWRSGRPGLGLRPAAVRLWEVAQDRLVAAFLLLFVAVIVVQLVLVCTAPANNWDSLTYHLPRAAAWAQHGGLHWIPHAPTDRMNEFQMLAEQQVLLLFVATRSGALFALPQFVALGAIVVGIYAAARRLGFERSSSICGSVGFSCLTLIVLETTTAQNDLVAAALPLAAAVFLLSGRRVEVVLAGMAIGLGVGVKLTTALVIPVLASLAARLGRRTVALVAVSAAVTFVVLAWWSFVLNTIETGQVLGYGGGRVEHTTNPSISGALSTAWRVTHGLLDLSGYGVTVALGAFAAGAIAFYLVYRSQRRSSVRALAAGAPAAVVALPLLAPMLTAILATLDRLLMEAIGHDHARGPNLRVQEDVSAFGPLGWLALLIACTLTLNAVCRGRESRTRLPFALALPTFVVLLALVATYNPWLSRFLIVPAALTAPLFARFFERRATSWAIFGVVATSAVLALAKNEAKPLDGSASAPWGLTQSEALQLTWQPAAGRARADIDALVPTNACVGAVLGVDEPAYILYGARHSRRVVYLPPQAAPLAAVRAGITYVVIGRGAPTVARTMFDDAGWDLRPLGVTKNRAYWTLAVDRRAEGRNCHVAADAPDASRSLSRRPVG